MPTTHHLYDGDLSIGVRGWRVRIGATRRSCEDTWPRTGGRGKSPRSGYVADPKSGRKENRSCPISLNGVSYGECGLPGVGRAFAWPWEGSACLSAVSFLWLPYSWLSPRDWRRSKHSYSVPRT